MFRTFLLSALFSCSHALTAQIDPCGGMPIEDLNQDGIADCVSIPGAVGAGTALDFADASRYVEMDNISGVFDLAQFTIEAWIWGPVSSATSLTDNPILWKVAENGANLDCFGLGVTPSGNISFRYEVQGLPEGSNDRVLTSTATYFGQPMHIAASFDGSEARLYIDGMLDTSLNLGPEVPAVGTAPVRVGNLENTDHGGDQRFDGHIDEVRIWNTALTVDALRSYSCQKNLFGHPNLSHLVSYLRFDEGTGMLTKDLARNVDVDLIGFPEEDWPVSCAKLGDRSVYTVAPLQFLSITAANGDEYSMNPLGPGCDIIWLYVVDDLEFQEVFYDTPALPVSLTYFGTRCANALTDMQMRYHYQQPLVNGVEGNLALALRFGRCTNWTAYATLQNPLENYLEYTVCGGEEYLLVAGDNSNGYIDTDGDGILDDDEALYNTDPNLCDSDGDGLGDGFELTVSMTDPALFDTNFNGCNDADEFGYLCEDPCPETEDMCPQDVTGDGAINTSDLLDVLGAFGAACP